MSTLNRRGAGAGAGAGAASTSTSSASPSPSRSPSPSSFPLSPSPLVSSSSSSSSSDDLSPLSLATHVVNERAAQKLNSIHVKAKAAVYFTVSTLLVFVILSNSLSRFLKTIWSDVGNNWAYAWAWLESWNFSPATLYIGFGFGVHLSIFWTYTAILTYFDFKPADQNPLSRWKMQPGKNEPVEPARYRYAVWIALRNQFFVHLPVLMITFPMVQWRGMSFTLPLPTFNEFLCDISVALVVEELMFYYSHRLFHHGAIYGYIHKFHHEWTAPIGIATIYAHPLEHLMSNLAPVFVGPFIMRSHIATTWVWQSVAVIVAMNTHSGYHLPFMPSPEAHDYHHLKFNQNYGVLGILDYMHGTDAMFRASKQFSRHRTLFSFDDAEFARPVPRQTIPVTSKDEQKNDEIKEKEKECDIKEGKQVEMPETAVVM